MSGSTSGLFAFSLPTNNAALPAFTLFGANPAQGFGYSPISPGALQTSQFLLGATINESLASVNANGSNEFNTIANLFNVWGQQQGQLSKQVAGAFTGVANKSAVACNGFFSCLF